MEFKRGVSARPVLWALAGLMAWPSWVPGSSTALAAPPSPEEETARLSRFLKPIPDDQWREIAGPRSSETYQIVKGDTLYDISKRLFGDAKYWPKIWALNNQTIFNPHLIRPGNQINFLPGSGTSLPSVEVQSGALTLNNEGTPSSPVDGAAPPSKDADQVKQTMARSQEWKLLPKQRWELIQIQPPPEVDAQGFDRRSRVTLGRGGGFELQAFAATDYVEPMGQIVSIRTDAQAGFLGEVAFIDPVGDLQVGETYSVVGDPVEIVGKMSQRKVLSYLVRGMIKIVGVKDGRFIGVVSATSGGVERGTFLIKRVPKVPVLKPIPGPSALQSYVLIDRQLLATHASAQYKQVFIDRGTDDGVRPGMVFRVYQYIDRVTQKTITDSDFIIDADIMIVQASERGSTGIVTRSIADISDQRMAVLLTDVSDLTLQRRSLEKNADSRTQAPDAVNVVDDLDISGPIGRQESQELRQLERWKQNNTDFSAPGNLPKPDQSPVAPGDVPPPADFENPVPDGALDSELDGDVAPVEEAAPDAQAAPSPSAGTEAAPPPPDLEAPAAPAMEQAPSAPALDTGAPAEPEAPPQQDVNQQDSNQLDELLNQ